MQNIVDIKNLKLIYQSIDSETTALENINLTIKPKELIKAITNEEFNPEYYCKYLEEKYSKIYQL